MGLAGALAREVRGHAARRRRHSLHGASAERRRRARCRDRPHLLDLPPRAVAGGPHLLRARQPRPRDSGRHLIYGYHRRPSAGDRCQERHARLGCHGRRRDPELLDHDVAERLEGQSHRRHGRRRHGYPRSHLRVRCEDRQRGVALLHDPGGRRAWQRLVARAIRGRPAAPQCGTRPLTIPRRISRSGARAIPRPIGTAAPGSATTCTRTPSSRSTSIPAS